MERIEFSEMTNRLRRNLMGSAFLIIGIAGFDIKVGKAQSSGMEFENLTTDVVLIILAGFLVYHVFAFAIRAFEEYRFWELKLTDNTASFWGGGAGGVNLADRIKTIGDALDNHTKNSGESSQETEGVLSNDEARELKQLLDPTRRYAKRFKNFPYVTRIRFWIWDIGSAGAIATIAVLFLTPVLPTGLLSCWLL